MPEEELPKKAKKPRKPRSSHHRSTIVKDLKKRYKTAKKALKEIEKDLESHGIKF